MDDDRKQLLIRSATVLGVVIALLAGLWFGWPLYKHYREAHAARMARDFLAHGDYRNAVLSARQALQLNSTNLAAAQVMAAIADLSQNPATLDWWQRIVQAAPTIENKLRLAVAGLRYQRPPHPLSRQILEALAPSATNLASYQAVAASLAVSLHDLNQAEAHFQAAAELEPTNLVYALNLAVVRLGQTNSAKAAQSRATLEQLGTNGPLAMLALRALVSDRLAHRDTAAALACSVRLLAGTNATLSDRLQHLAILQQLPSDEFGPTLKTLQQQASTNALAVAEMAAWMAGHDLLAEDLRWLTHLPAALRVQAPVRLALADGYLISTNWHALQDFATHGNWEEDEYLRMALVALAWDQLGGSQVAEGNWVSAINEAGNRLGALTRLLALAEKWKLPLQQERLLERISERFPRERWAQHALESFYVTEGNTAGLNHLYARMFQIYTNDITLENNLAYTSLLLKTNLRQASQWAEQIYIGQTSNAVIAATYSFALHLRGHTEAGLAVLNKLSEPDRQRPDIALYYGVLLAAAHHTNQAAPYLAIARTKTQWLPEESRLLTSAGTR